MNLLTRVRRADQVDVDDVAVDDFDPSAVDGTPTSHQWTGASALTTKGMSVLLWCLLAAGPVALVVQLMSPPPPTPVVLAGSTDTTQATERAAVSGFAEDMVVTWLSTPRGREQTMERFVVDASSITLPEKPWTASVASTTSIDATDRPGVWAVTVAVTVDEGTDEVPVRRYFQVPVHYSDIAGLRAQTLPAPVAGPAVAAGDRLSYRYRATQTDPVAAAANDFLSALLAGPSDVARYVSPGSEITAIEPAPYTTVLIDDVRVDVDPAEDGTSPANGAQRHLLVTATVTAAAGQDLSVQYALTFAARDGRWEVTSIDPAPVVADSSQDLSTPAAPAQTPAPSEPVTPSTTN